MEREVQPQQRIINILSFWNALESLSDMEMKIKWKQVETNEYITQINKDKRNISKYCIGLNSLNENLMDSAITETITATAYAMTGEESRIVRLDFFALNLSYGDVFDEFKIPADELDDDNFLCKYTIRLKITKNKEGNFCKVIGITAKDSEKYIRINKSSILLDHMSKKSKKNIDEIVSTISNEICEITARYDTEVYSNVIGYTKIATNLYNDIMKIVAKLCYILDLKKENIHDIGTIHFDDSPLMSNLKPFYKSDIEIALNHYKKDGSPTLLDKYLIPLKSSNADIRYDNNTLKELLSPKNYPPGKWPSPFTPAYMQQVCINIAVNNNKEAPLFSVNGPPGTGKTTLLKEIFVDAIVKKAIIMAKLNTPDELFSNLVEDDNNNRINAYAITGDIVKTGILVLSNNNSAVENVTSEIPKLSGITGGLTAAKDKYIADNIRLFTDDAYFTDISNSEDGSKKNWGIISARLGKRDNMLKFIKNFIEPFLTEKIKNNAQKSNFKAVSVQFLNQYNEVKSMLESENNKNTFKPNTPGTDMSSQMKGNPLNNLKLDAERIKLFYLALQVIKAFCLESDCLAHNLEQYKQYILTKDTITEQYISTSLFNSLFLLIPVVSSTFASVGNLLKDLTQPACIGTVIVDESGQAQPAAAVGSIYRSQRTIIVGDPYQVEPIFTIPSVLLKKESPLATALNLSYEGMEPYFFDKRQSVQTFADRANPYHAFINNEWVGCPLNVHRRCTEPMFSMSNMLSYSNSMINATAECNNDTEKLFLSDYSRWYDYPDNEVGGGNHYSNKQGALIIKGILRSFEKYKTFPDLFIISPFKSVINTLKASLKETASNLNAKREITASEMNAITLFADRNIGTVHKFQGREAAEVFFFLGCDSSSISSIRWVNANCVNVAVTRAKYRLYIVGDYTLWTKYNKYINIAVAAGVRRGFIVPGLTLPMPKDRGFLLPATT